MTLVFKDHVALSQLYASCAAIVDAADWDAWCELFTDECIYRLVLRGQSECPPHQGRFDLRSGAATCAGHGGRQDVSFAHRRRACLAAHR